MQPWHIPKSLLRKLSRKGLKANGVLLGWGVLKIGHSALGGEGLIFK